jgi:hypothetical protein
MKLTFPNGPGYRRAMQRSLMTTTPDLSGVRLLLP